jgi:rubrerythrin
MSYESPISVIYRDIAEQVTQQNENSIMQAVNMYVQVDKAELVRALEYDRGQYEKGYADAKRDYERTRGEWITDERGYLCSECGALHSDDYPFCHMCGADMRKEAPDV